MITLNSWGNLNQSNHQAGVRASLFADLKAEIVAENDTVATANEGNVKCIAGSSCITAAGELLFINSSGVWNEVV